MTIGKFFKADLVYSLLGKSIHPDAARWMGSCETLKVNFLRGILFSLFIIFSMTHAYSAENIEDKILIERRGMLFNNKTNTYDQILRLKNISKEILLAPIVLNIKIASMLDVVVYNAVRDKRDSFIIIPEFANGVFGPSETKDVLIQFANVKNQKFKYTTSLSGSILSKDRYAAAHIKIYEFSGDSQSPVGRPIAEPGIRILVNGAFRGVTNPNGEIFLSALEGKNEIFAQKSLTEGGVATVDLHSEGLNDIKIIVDSGKEIFGDASLISDQIQHGLLRSELAAMNMRLIKPSGEIIKLSALDSISLSVESRNLKNITNLFKIIDQSTISLVDVGEMRRLLLGAIGEIKIEVVATSSDETPYYEKISFRLEPQINSESLKLNQGLEGKALEGVSLLPIAHYEVKNIKSIKSPAHPVYGSAENLEFYKLAGAISEENSDTEADVEVGELPIPSHPNENYFRQNSCATIMKTKFEKTVNVVLEGCDIVEYVANIPQKKKASLLIRKGTKAITLVYNVRAFALGFAYPYSPIRSFLEYYDLFYFRGYLEPDFIFEFNENTQWGVSLHVDGVRIFGIEKNIQSQILQEPRLVLDGEDLRTGKIKKTFDISDLAKDQDVVVELAVFFKKNTNYTRGGEIFFWPPVVVAGLQVESELLIGSIDAVKDHWISRNDGTFYSIPESGNFNEFHREFDILIQKPEDLIIESAKVELLGTGSAALILNQDLGSDGAISNGNKIRVLGTFKINPSTIARGAPAKSTRYRFTINGKDSSGNPITGGRVIADKKPLWRMPPDVARFGDRDQGQDDWCAKDTYDWIVANRGLLAAINDVSGEHGKDLGHKTHAEGTDIDMYGFYIFPGANINNGSSNYNLLVKSILNIPKIRSGIAAVRDAGEEAVQNVKQWVIATRDGIDAIGALPTVSQIGYIKNGPNSVGIVGSNWGAILIRAGKVTIQGQEFDLATGPWDNPKYFAWPAHHDHVHITLRSEQ